MVKPSVLHLTYAENLIANYQNLTHLPGFVLLESSDRQYGRYDIISACPYDQLIVDKHSTPLFERLGELVNFSKSLLDLPFQGGAIGYISYDFATQSLNIPSKRQLSSKNLPLALFNLYDWALLVDHHSKTVILFSANTRKETSGIIQEVLSLWDQCSKNHDFSLLAPFTPLISIKDYQKGFAAIYAALKQGRCYQTNYTQPFMASYQGDAWELFKIIRQVNPVPFSSFLRTKYADILSFSPERFLLADQDYILTSPIKGTIKRSTDLKEDEYLKQTLKNSSKDQAENVMIVDLLRNDLGKIAQPGSVKVSSLFEVQSYRAVHHLVSHIEAKLRSEVSLGQAFEACFPGGSITGAPKIEAMRVIAEEELYARGLYCGSIAYFSRHGRFDSNIAIRTLIASEGKLHLGAGGAIVIDSNCDSEYRECLTKIEAIVTALTKYSHGDLKSDNRFI